MSPSLFRRVLMTSGQFTSFPVDAITIPPDRQRKENLSVEDLIPSIRDRGLINPIVITREGVLVAGERRLTAVRALGWDKITVQFTDELNEIQLHLIELEENVKRKNLTWQNECAAVLKYHQFQLSLEPDWTHEKTADALGYGRQTISDYLGVAKEIVSGNTRVAEAPKFSTAKNITVRNAARKRDSAISEIFNEPEPEKSIPLLNADFREWSKSYEGPKFNFIHCDFPYGVNADEHDQGSAADHGGYEDGFEVYTELLDVLSDSMDNIVADSAHLMFWFSLDYYEYTRIRLSDMGWRVNPFPLIWHKSDNTGILPDAKRGPRRIYETAFFASRGDRFVVQPVSNCFSHGVTKTIHMSEKPVGMLKHFFRMFVDEHSLVLDPTCGSANSIRAAKAAGAALVFGIERDTEFFNLAKEHFYDEEI